MRNLIFTPLPNKNHFSYIKDWLYIISDIDDKIISGYLLKKRFIKNLYKRSFVTW